MTTNEHAHIKPTEAATRFLNTRKEEVSQATIRNQTTPVNQFAEYIEDQEKQLSQLNGLDIQQYYDQLTVKKVSRRQYMVAIRQFIRYLERLDLTPKGLSEQVYVPSIDKNEWKRDEEIKPKRVQGIVNHLGTSVTAASSTSPGYVQDTLPANSSVNGTTFQIDDYWITLQNDSYPKMNGSTIGYAYPDGPKQLYIEKGLSAETTYDTCVHEHLHQLGIDCDTNQHYWVNKFEDRLVDPLCLRFLARINSTEPGRPQVNS